ncbi:hypothetical protein ZIOFF_029270 [Zingiber officinale]|uniref:Uncharacterized protein n=1 Tax=Zingiber officinale TaxID=94328 RepID=A0A8J5LFZ7_ZINOF|nr:hypothetical protein ZIOFF_029270 [Zingiber officinale]
MTTRVRKDHLALFLQGGNFLRRWIPDFAPLSPNLLMEKDLLREAHKSLNFRLSDFLGTNFAVFDGQRPSLMLLRNQEAE